MPEFETTEELLQHYEEVNHRICVEAPTKYVQRAKEIVVYRQGIPFQPDALEGPPVENDRCELGLLYFTMPNVIKRIIAKHEQDYGLEPGMIAAPRRFKKIVDARHAAVCEIYRIYRTKVSLPTLGRHFGLDHTSILHILRKYELMPQGNSQKYNRKPEFSTGATKVPISPSQNVHSGVSNQPQM